MTKTVSKRVIVRAGAVLAVCAAILSLFTINIPPFKAFDGAVWVKGGIQYVGNTQISDRVTELNAPKEEVLSSKIQAETISCDAVEEGFCQRTPGQYSYKTLTKAAVAYVPATPDTKQVLGYCTLCNDGTFSPSCAVGRGACSWHDGVAAYNVERYRIIPGTPAVEAQDAVYSYTPRIYQDSALYVEPDAPALSVIVGY